MSRGRGDLERRLLEIADRYSEGDQALRLCDAPRFAEVAEWIGEARSVLDIGGGYSALSLLLAGLGKRVTVLDDFSHAYFSERLDHRRLVLDAGVELVEQDAVSGEPLPFPDSSFQAVTSLDSMEHWHHSPRRLFHEVVRVLAPGGVFILGVPNAVNLRKRMVVPLGKTNWSRFEDWYFEPTFYGHVREPTVSDLSRIAADMALASWRIVGRNWLGYRRGGRIKLATTVLDRPLRLRPSLCANIYLIGRRRA